MKADHVKIKKKEEKIMDGVICRYSTDDGVGDCDPKCDFRSDYVSRNTKEEPYCGPE